MEAELLKSGVCTGSPLGLLTDSLCTKCGAGLSRQWRSTYVGWATFVGSVVQPTFCFQGLTGTLGVLREIRALPEAIGKLAGCIHRITGRLDRVLSLQERNGPLEARLEELERSRAAWEATMEAEIQRASSTYKSAANAESRARTMENHAAKLTDPLSLEGEEIEEGLPVGYASGSEADGLLPMRMDVAPPDKKELAKRMKFLS